MSIASSSQVDPAYKIYRRYKDKCEDVWDNGDVKPPPPPCIVLVQGPPSVGKSLLIKSLVKYFTKESPSPSPGPITIIIGNTRKRLQFVECPDDINGMIDAAKYADLVLLLADASYGFEAETFEFLNLLQAHGFPEVMGVFTHLDEFEDEKELKVETIECLKDHFWTEIYQGATISCLSGLYNDLYRMEEVQQLAQHISMLQPRSSSLPYVLVDCIEDVSAPEELHKDANCKRNISLCGYLRGGNISKSGAKVHLAGVGDFRLAGVTSTTDPFPFSYDSEMGKDFVDIKNQSFRPGTYVRLEVHDVPFQVVDKFDPCHPILVVGGISLEEENAGYIQARLKRHNWHIKLLKSAEAVTVSAGWRRYQTKPIDASEIDSGRHEILEFNSEHEQCLAMFWGPLASPSTRIVVVHGTKEVFRIAAKAVVLDPMSHLKIMKECKLDGKPLKILEEKTALIKFKSKDIDVAEFEGSPIRTNFRCIWGKVIQAEGRKGIAKCTFEKKICMRDRFIMPVFVQVGAPRSFKPCGDSNHKDSLKKRRLRLEQRRRRVEIVDEEPCSHPPDSAYYTLFRNIKYMDKKGKETVVVMSEEKRLELLKKQQIEKNKKLREIGVGW